MVGLRVLKLELCSTPGPIGLPVISGWSTIEAPVGRSLDDRDQTINRLLTVVGGTVAERRYCEWPEGSYNAVEDFDRAQTFVQVICPDMANPLVEQLVDRLARGDRARTDSGV
jgi:hypothetical protein